MGRHRGRAGGAHQLEKELEEKDFRLKRAQEMTTALSAGGIDDEGGIG